MKRPDHLFYAFVEVPPPGKLLLLSLQHFCVMSVYFVILIVILRSTQVSPYVSQNVISFGMIAVAISSSLQSLWKGHIGSGYLAPSGFSAMYF